MQTQQAPLIFAETERPLGERLLKLALETDRVEGYTEPHAVMIARLTETIGRQMGLHGIDLTALKFAALAHDFGERGMKRNYLLGPNKLSWEETLDLWRHPILGEQAASELRLSRQTQLLIRWHHEWWNGQGYPDGLSGESIPLGARILRAVDSYCALISQRPYRQEFNLLEAEQVIADLAGIEFDPQIVKLLLAIVSEERRQREAEVWQVEPEPDLQYVSPVEEPLYSAHAAEPEMAVEEAGNDDSNFDRNFAFEPEPTPAEISSPEPLIESDSEVASPTPPEPAEADIHFARPQIISLNEADSVPTLIDVPVDVPVNSSGVQTLPEPQVVEGQDEPDETENPPAADDDKRNSNAQY